jgi:hypothetical protein
MRRPRLIMFAWMIQEIYSSRNNWISPHFRISGCVECEASVVSTVTSSGRRAHCVLRFSDLPLCNLGRGNQSGRWPKCRMTILEIDQVKLSVLTVTQWISIRKDEIRCISAFIIWQRSRQQDRVASSVRAHLHRQLNPFFFCLKGNSSDCRLGRFVDGSVSAMSSLRPF